MQTGALNPTVELGRRPLGHKRPLTTRRALDGNLALPR